LEIFFVTWFMKRNYFMEVFRLEEGRLCKKKATLWSERNV